MLSTEEIKVKRNVEYVYLLQEREFLKLNMPVYKIGRTAQENTKRVTQYPKDSVLHLHTSCSDSVKAEKDIIQFFKEKYIHRKDIGNEYFEGNFELMKNDINKIISQMYIINLVKYENFLSNDKIIEDSDETNCCTVIDGNNDNDAKERLDNEKKFTCTLCAYKTDKRWNMNTHITSDKHKFTMWQQNSVKAPHKCKCGKSFKHKPSLSRHKRSCTLLLKVKEKYQSLLNETI